MIISCWRAKQTNHIAQQQLIALAWANWRTIKINDMNIDMDIAIINKNLL